MNTTETDTTDHTAESLQLSLTHLATLMDAARLAGDVELYCDLQDQMGMLLSGGAQ